MARLAGQKPVYNADCWCRTRDLLCANIAGYPGEGAQPAPTAQHAFIIRPQGSAQVETGRYADKVVI